MWARPYPANVTGVGDLVQKARGIPSAAMAQLGRRIPTRGRGAAVLCYHDVGVDPENATDYYVTPDLFRSHLEWIRQWGFTFVPLTEIVDRLLAGRDLDGLVAVTFDDALTGVREPAAPLLITAHIDRKSTRLNSSHIQKSRMPSSA